jgi:sugar O-acyltransferase (sialic acid O-acetyltransferase NeuD family)
MKLYIVGAGGFGREVKAWVESYRLPFEFAGFVDDTATGPSIVSNIESHCVDATSAYIVAIGNGKTRVRILKDLAARNAKIVSIKSPLGSATSDLGEFGGIYLGAYSVSSSCEIGMGVLIHGFACVGHDVRLGDGVTLGSHSFVGGNASIGMLSTVHPHSVILPDVRVGDNVTVGAGSVVVKNVPDNVTVFGSPAKIIFTK